MSDLYKPFDIENINFDSDEACETYFLTLTQYIRVVKILSDYNNGKVEIENSVLAELYLRQYKLYMELRRLSLSTLEKLNIYCDGKAYMLEPDGLGQDTRSGRLLPTQKEVEIGMYPKRELLFFPCYTSGVYRFYTTDGKYNLVGGSQYIEFAVHSYFTKWRWFRKNEAKGVKVTDCRKLRSLEYLVYNKPELVRFEIVDKVPYTLIPYATAANRIKYNATWMGKIHFDPKKYDSGIYGK